MLDAVRVSTLLLLALLGCTGPQTARRTAGPLTSEPEIPPARATTSPPAERLASTHRIDDPRTWARLAARPATETFARTEVVKFLIDLEDERRLWFTDTERFEIHFHFARDVLGVDESHGDFNVREYRRPERRFVMGTLVHYLDPDLWAFEMVAGDNLDGARVLEAFEQVQGAVFFGDRLRYRAISPLHERRTEGLGARLPRVSAGEVFRGVRYQPLTQGVAYGTLRLVRGPLDAASVRPTDILVLEHLPDGIPVSSAVISQELQAPLGHLALLCATRGTPNMGLRDALSDPAIAALDGQLVRLDVASQEHAIRAATRAEAEEAWAARRPAQPLTPQIDRGFAALTAVCDARIGDAPRIGAKAAQLGEVCAEGLPTPGGFAVPFAHYLRHLERHGLAGGLRAMLEDATFRGDPRVRAENLAQLRAVIARSPVDPALLREVRRRIEAFPGEPRVIFRSSTNAEDLPGFTGAGLYRSVVVSGGASDAELADALREVWASVWLSGAYEERDWYRIDHREVAMAVLVQPFVDGAIANGVAITANPFYEARPGYFVNAQALGGSVTGAAGDEIPEQHLIYTYADDGPELELVSRSTRGDGALLLREPELMQLHAALARLDFALTPYWSGRANAVDVEFLVAGPDRRVVILQARPFCVRYTEGQRAVHRRPQAACPARLYPPRAP